MVCVPRAVIEVNMFTVCMINWVGHRDRTLREVHIHRYRHVGGRHGEAVGAVVVVGDGSLVFIQIAINDFQRFA